MPASIYCGEILLRYEGKAAAVNIPLFVSLSWLWLVLATIARAFRHGGFSLQCYLVGAFCEMRVPCFSDLAVVHGLDALCSSQPGHVPGHLHLGLSEN